MPVLAFAMMWIGLNGVWAVTEVAGRLQYDTPAAAVLKVTGLLGAFATPALMLLSVADRHRRGWKLAASGVIVIYATLVIRPVSQVVLAARDYVSTGQVGSSEAEQIAAGQRIMRENPDPEAAARRALRAGDKRIFVIDGIGPMPVGIRWSPWAELRFGSRVMPGFSEMESDDPAARAYRSVALCWVWRYDRALATRLDDPRAPKYLAPDDRMKPCAAPSGAS